VAETAAVDVPEVIVTDVAPRAGDRRARFREAVSGLATRSTSDDLVRWMLVPGSVAVLLGFSVMVLGWVGAARTAREIEQIPYLISGGLIGLGLVVLGGLLLVSTFWVAVLRKLDDERSGADPAELEVLRARIAELEAAAVASNGTRRATAKPRVRAER
jgi:hypothetical protein